MAEQPDRLQGYIKTETMRIKIAGNKRGFPFDETLEVMPPFEEGVLESVSSFPSVSQDFHEFFESVYDAVILTMLDGSLWKYNERAVEYFQYPRESMYRLNILNLISGANEETLKTIISTLQNQRRIFIECYCIQRDGTLFPAEITVNLLQLQKYQILCFFIRNITVRIQTQEALREAQKELMETAHRAGMAEIATSILHDVGNLLNSVNVSCELICNQSRHSAINTFIQMVHLLRQQENITQFLTEDPRGKRFPQLLVELASRLEGERNKIIEESENLRNKIGLIREVIQMQQAYAKAGLFEEETDVQKLVEDAIAIHRNPIQKAQIQVIKRYQPVPLVRVAKSKLVHILLNLLKNAEESLSNVPVERRKLIIEIFNHQDEEIGIKIQDTGLGIDPENLGRIFTHGFTTKATGHGFGLHSCANMIKEMKGRIEVESPGINQGATFTVYIPIPEKHKGTS